MQRSFARKERGPQDDSAVEQSSRTNMKAIRVSHTGGPEVMELAEVSVPQAKPGEAVVKVHVRGCEFH